MHALLHGDDEPPGTVGHQIQALLKLGYNKILLQEAIDRIADIPWTTNIQEQGHAGAALFHKHHKQYGNNMLTARAHLFMIRPLLRPDPSFKQSANTREKIEKLDRRLRTRITGRHIFLGDLYAARSTLESASSSQELAEDVMRDHGRWWSALSSDSQSHYAARAALHNNSRAVNLREEQESLLENMRLSNDRLAEENLQQMQLLRLSNCVWGEVVLEKFWKFIDEGDFSTRKVDELRTQALEPPAAPSASNQAAMQTMPVHRPTKPSAPSSWMKSLAKARDHLHGCIVAIRQLDVDVSYFMFLYAKESPYLLWFLPLTLQTTLVMTDVPDNMRMGDKTPPPLWEFLADPLDIKTHHDIPDVDKDRVFLLPQVGLSQADPLLYRSWLDFMPVGFVLE